MIITIDGPTASGKSSAAIGLARQLGFFYINSGMLYRALGYTLHILDAIPLADFPSLDKALLQKAVHDILYTYDAVDGVCIYVRNVAVTDLLKSSNMDKVSSTIATNALAREYIMQIQHALAIDHDNNIVADGRDSGSTVFPYADYKFFLTAAPEIRADRWRIDQGKRGNDMNAQEALSFILERDRRDTERKIAPLVIAADARIVDNSALSKETVIFELMQNVEVVLRRSR